MGMTDDVCLRTTPLTFSFECTFGEVSTLQLAFNVLPYHLLRRLTAGSGVSYIMLNFNALWLTVHQTIYYVPGYAAVTRGKSGTRVLLTCGRNYSRQLLYVYPLSVNYRVMYTFNMSHIGFITIFFIKVNNVCHSNSILLVTKALFTIS